MTSLKLRTFCAKTTCLRTAALVLMWAITAHAAPTQTLPLSVAMTRAASADPARTATTQRLKAAEANLHQAGIKPNPSLGLRVENALGGQPYGGIDQAETTLSYQQTLERTGKRKARLGVAAYERDLAIANGRLRTLDLMTEVQTVWIDAAVAEAELRLALERLTMTKATHAEVSRRVKAARDPLFAGSLADADLAHAKIALEQARQKAQALKAQLAAYWNGSVDFELDPLWLEDTGAAKTEPALMETPDIERLRAQQRIATAHIGLETAKSASDPTFEAGVRHFKADGAVALMVGGSIPLGARKANAGAVARSRAEAMAAASDIEASERMRMREMAAITPQLIAYAEEVRRIDAEVMPQLQRAVIQVREGFARGGFSYRDVTGAQDALMSIRERRLTLLKSFQLLRTRRERLAGLWVPLMPAQDVNP